MNFLFRHSVYCSIRNQRALEATWAEKRGHFFSLFVKYVIFPVKFRGGVGEMSVSCTNSPLDQTPDILVEGRLSVVWTTTARVSENTGEDRDI